MFFRFCLFYVWCQHPIFYLAQWSSTRKNTLQAKKWLLRNFISKLVNGSSARKPLQSWKKVCLFGYESAIASTPNKKKKVFSKVINKSYHYIATIFRRPKLGIEAIKRNSSDLPIATVKQKLVSVIQYFFNNLNPNWENNFYNIYIYIYLFLHTC